MQWPSLSVILSEIFLAYIIYSIYTLSLLFVSPACEDGKPCLESYLSDRPLLDLYMYSSIRRNPASRDANLVYSAQNFDYDQTQTMWASCLVRASHLFFVWSLDPVYRSRLLVFSGKAEKERKSKWNLCKSNKYIFFFQSSDIDCTKWDPAKWNIVPTYIINAFFCKTGQNVYRFAKGNAICNIIKYINISSVRIIIRLERILWAFN